MNLLHILFRVIKSKILYKTIKRTFGIKTYREKEQNHLAIKYFKSFNSSSSNLVLVRMSNEMERWTVNESYVEKVNAKEILKTSLKSFGRTFNVRETNDKD